MKYVIYSKLQRFVVTTLILALIPLEAQAAGLAPRSVTTSSSQAGVSSTYVANFTIASNFNVGSIRFDICTTATGVCTVPAGVTTTAATLSAQSGAIGFTMNNTTNGSPFITRAPSAISSGTAVSYTLGAIFNPNITNFAYYLRISTYSGIDGLTGPVDQGTVAMSTAQQVQLTGVTPEILVFCVGTNVTGDCTTMTGSTIDFGDFSPSATRSGTSVMQAATNASGGYSITVNGTTLSSGVNTIPALTAQTFSTTGVGQYGLNLRANANPAVGADPTVAAGALGVPASNYNAVDQYRFVTGDVVATAPSPTNSNTYTSSYIVNIGGAQAAGVYTATMTYICTANF